MTSNSAQRVGTSGQAASARYDVLDLVRAFAILGMLGSHLVGTEGGATALERGITWVLGAIEPTVGALFCVVAGISWSIQAERVGVTPRFRRYFVGRALALGALGIGFHLLFWKTEILVPFALMMVVSIIVLGARPRGIALALLLFVAVTPAVARFATPYAATDWLDNGLHAADHSVGWVTLRYLLVDGNYPLISWMAFPLMGMLFWRTARGRPRTLAWFFGSLGVAVTGYAIAVRTAPKGGAVLDWIAQGWTPTSAIFLVTAGAGAVAVIAALLWRWGTTALPRAVQPLVLFGRASLTHYVLHIAVAYSLLRVRYPDEDWTPGTGLWAMLAYLAIGIPLTVYWYRHHTHGPIEALLARASRRPEPPSPDDGAREVTSVAVMRSNGFASLRAVRSFAPGEIVMPLQGHPEMRPTRFTIQVGTGDHIAPISEHVSPWGYTNHGCDPNLAIDVPRRVIVARRPIASGDELCFDYHTTEWELDEPFVCHCASPRCVGLVRGFAHLPPARQEVLLGSAAPHIQALHALRAPPRHPRAPGRASLGIEKKMPSAPLPAR